MINVIKTYIMILMIVVFLPGCTAIQVMKMVNSGEAIPNQYSESVVPITHEVHPILIKARLNNSDKEYIFVFDTGALTMIDSKVAKELNLSKGVEVEAQGTGGNSKKVEIVQLDNVIVGDMEVRDCAVAITDFSEFLTPNIAGILGSNFFKHFKVTIDYPNKNITFSQEKKPTVLKSQDIKIPFEINMRNGFAPTVDCQVDGEIQAQAIIDTGYPGIASLPLSIMMKTQSFKAGNVLAAQGNMMGGMFGAGGKTYGGRIAELEIGDLKLNNVPTITHSAKNNLILIGSKFLEKYLVILDYPAQEMILRPYGKPLETNIPSYGLALAKKDKKTIVSGIWDNSSASKNGIELGDEIVKINSKDARTLSLFELIPFFISEGQNTMEVEFVNKKREYKSVKISKEMLF